MAILTLATENLPVKNTFIDLDIGTSAQLESAFKDSMNFSISRFHVFHVFLEFQKDSGGSNKWTMRVKAYRDLREVILKVLWSLAGPMVGQEHFVARCQPTSHTNGYRKYISAPWSSKVKTKLTPNRIPSLPLLALDFLLSVISCKSLHFYITYVIICHPLGS